MSRPFDAGLKDLGADFPRDFLCTFDAPPTGPVRPLNADLSTITTAADLVLGIGEPHNEIVHIDFQSQAKAAKHRDVLAYNVLLFRHDDVPVHSIIVPQSAPAGRPLQPAPEVPPRHCCCCAFDPVAIGP